VLGSSENANSVDLLQCVCVCVYSVDSFHPRLQTSSFRTSNSPASHFEVSVYVFSCVAHIVYENGVLLSQLRLSHRSNGSIMRNVLQLVYF